MGSNLGFHKIRSATFNHRQGLLERQPPYRNHGVVAAALEGKKLRPLAITAARRAGAIPEVPTFDELGLGEVRLDVWFGLAGPADMAADIVRTINSAVNHALSDGKLKDQLLRLGSDAHPDSAGHFSEFWASEVKRYADVVRLSGATLE